jgi:hypothetical protein
LCRAFWRRSPCPRRSRRRNQETEGSNAVSERWQCVVQGVLEEVTLLQEITETCRGAVRAFVEDRTDSKGRVSEDSLNNFARSMGFGQQPWTKALKVCVVSASFGEFAVQSGVHSNFHQPTVRFAATLWVDRWQPPCCFPTQLSVTPPRFAQPPAIYHRMNIARAFIAIPRPHGRGDSSVVSTDP